VESGLLKLNLGCGSHKLAGWVNVDKEPACAPDRVVDLEALPWPFEDDSVGEAMFRHSLEHLGQTPAVYLGVDFEIVRATMRPTAQWRERLTKGLVRESDFAEAARLYNNVIREIEVVLAARK
jgi:hypothetical protein